jgi:hypothetical protein
VTPSSSSAIKDGILDSLLIDQIHACWRRRAVFSFVRVSNTLVRSRGIISLSEIAFCRLLQPTDKGKLRQVKMQCHFAGRESPNRVHARVQWGVGPQYNYRALTPFECTADSLRNGTLTSAPRFCQFSSRVMRSHGAFPVPS